MRESLIRLAAVEPKQIAVPDESPAPAHTVLRLKNTSFSPRFDDGKLQSGFFFSHRIYLRPGGYSCLIQLQFLSQSVEAGGVARIEVARLPDDEGTECICALEFPLGEALLALADD